MILKNENIKRHNGRAKILPIEYATYRKEILKYLFDKVLLNSKIILDPMCGTAPLIPYLENKGLTAYFNDILPVHYIVNSAKTFKTYKNLLFREKRNESFFIREIESLLKGLANKRQMISDNWFHESVLEIFIKAWGKTNSYDLYTKTLLKAVIVLCLRPYSCCTKSFNTTWIKKGGISTSNNLRNVLKEKIYLLKHYYEEAYSNLSKSAVGKCYFYCSDAKSFDLDNNVDTIITSPSYCNRLDYYTLYAPEHYFLSHVGYPCKKEEILGTNIVRNYHNEISNINYLKRNAPLTADFLKQITGKKAKDVKYYYQYYIRYFVDLYFILNKYMSFLSKKGHMYIIVQNNIHRGEYIQLDEFICNYFKKIGFAANVVKKFTRAHQGRRNISADYPLVIKKHYESIIGVSK